MSSAKEQPDVFKLGPAPAGTVGITGHIANNLDVDLIFRGANGGNDPFDPQPPPRIPARGVGSFSISSMTRLGGLVEYSATIDGKEIRVFAQWDVPILGYNSFYAHTEPTGVLYVLISGDKSGWHPDLTWTVSRI